MSGQRTEEWRAWSWMSFLLTRRVSWPSRMNFSEPSRMPSAFQLTNTLLRRSKQIRRWLWGARTKLLRRLLAGLPSPTRGKQRQRLRQSLDWILGTWDRSSLLNSPKTNTLLWTLPSSQHSLYFPRKHFPKYLLCTTVSSSYLTFFQLEFDPFTQTIPKSKKLCHEVGQGDKTDQTKMMRNLETEYNTLKETCYDQGMCHATWTSSCLITYSLALLLIIWYLRVQHHLANNNLHHPR